jgi:hypothetical protein
MRIARIVYEPLVQHDVLDWGFAGHPRGRGVVDGLGRRADLHVHDPPDARWSNGEPPVARALRVLVAPRDAARHRVGLRRRCSGSSRAPTRSTPGASSSSRDGAGRERVRRRARALGRDARAVRPDSSGSHARRSHAGGRLSEPVPYFLDLCAFAVFCPVYPPLVEQYERPTRDGAARPPARLDAPPELVSNGPFTVACDWRFKRDMRLEQNPHYWNRESLNMRSIASPRSATRTRRSSRTAPGRST